MFIYCKDGFILVKGSGKMRKVAIITTFVVFLGSIMALTGVSGEATISYTDPTGDVDAYQAPQSLVDNADITALDVDAASDPMVIEITVVGTHDLEQSEVMYQYYIHFDHDGDGIEDSQIWLTSFGNLFYVGESSDSFTGEISGDGTSTLTVEVSWETLELSEQVDDVYLEISMVQQPSYSVADEVNLEFGGGGGTDDDTDDDTTDDDDPWEDYYGPEENYENTNDPGSESPTDGSISVDIGSFEYEMEMGDPHEEWHQTMEGTTSGEVSCAAFSIVFYLKSGGTNDVTWFTGPFNMPEMTQGDVTQEMHFKGMGAGGKDDWSAWEMYMYGKRPSSDDNEIRTGETCVNISDVDKVVIYVRAFSDPSLAMWNQDSLDVTDDYMEASGGNGDDDDDGDDDDTPGFTLPLAVLSALLASSVVLYRRIKTDR